VAAENLEDRPIFCSVLSQKAAQGRFFRRAVRIGNLSLHMELTSGKTELFDLVADPGERRSVDTRVEERDQLRALVLGSITGNLEQVELVDGD
jgi:hypothetical protein